MTLQERLNKIPSQIKFKKNYYGLVIIKNDSSWTVHYIRIVREDKSIFESTEKNLNHALMNTLRKMKYKKIKL